MNDYKNDSLLEIAVSLMRSKKKPKPLKDLTNEVFQAKGIMNDEDIDERKAQFQVDFMTSGYFVCCGENKKGHKLWDLKNRQPVSTIDKEGNYLEDVYADDEDVIKNELKDDIPFVDDLDGKEIDSYIEDDEEDEDDDDTSDDIEEELGLTGDEEDDTEEVTTKEVYVSTDDDEEDEEDEDEIEKELNKKSSK